jgi:flagellar motor switch protein FliG
MAVRIDRDQYKTLTGQEKAAMLMLALGETYSIKLFRLMQDEEIREISQTMATLGKVEAAVIEKLLMDFVESFSQTGSLVGSYDTTERLLAQVMDSERVGAIMEDIRGPAGRTMWDKLGNVNENVLANFLKNEYPQTVSVVLSKVRPDHAAKVLGLLPESLAMDVINRMLKMEAVKKEVLNDVEKTLRNEFMSNIARTNKRDAFEMMAEIFNGFDRSTESRFMSALEERDGDSAEKIKAMMFTFNDLNRLDPTGIQAVLRDSDKEKLAVALKGASEGIREMFFGNMSERAAKILREDIEAMGPVKVRDVEDAQMHVVRVAKDLSDKGEIDISDSKGGDELVY